MRLELPARLQLAHGCFKTADERIVTDLQVSHCHVHTHHFRLKPIHKSQKPVIKELSSCYYANKCLGFFCRLFSLWDIDGTLKNNKWYE
jgi:hypothetical protein